MCPKSIIRFSCSFLIVLLTIANFTSAEEITPPKTEYIPDIEIFMQIGNNGSPQITNDGKTLFFRTTMSGTSQLYRLTEEGWPYQLTLFEDGIDFFTLSPNGKLAVIGASTGGSEDAQLFLMQTETGQIKQITETPAVRYGSITWRHDNSGFYFRANLANPKDYFIYFFNLNTGQTDLILDFEGSNYLSDISLDDNYLVMMHVYSNVAGDLYLIDLADNKAIKITPDKENVFYDTPFILPDNNTIIMVCNDNPAGITKLAKLNITTGKIEYLEPESKWTTDLLTLSENREYLAWQVNEEGYSVIKLMNVTKSQLLPAPPVKGLATTPSLANDGSLAFQFTSSVSAPDIWLWNFSKPELKKMTHAIYAGIDNSIFIDPLLIKYKSFDGLEIPAFLYLPPNYEGQPVPFIVHAHGGPESQFRPYLQRHFQYLLLNGFGVIAPNVRGSDGYGKEYINMDNYKNRLKSIKDYKAATEYLIDNNYAAKGMIGIKGSSYGGYVVLACITEYPELFSAAIDHVGIANYVTFLENTRDYRRHIREAEYGPLTDPEFLQSISPIHKANLIKTPLLVVHGENDPRVPVGEARQIIEAINQNNGEVDSLIFADEGHGMGKRGNRLAYYRKMVDFFNKYLK